LANRIRTLFNESHRRRLLLCVYAALLLGVVATTIAFAYVLLISPRVSSADLFAKMADLLAAGTLLLALIAGLVALQAYAAATGLPSLQLQVWFRGSSKNSAKFLVSAAEYGWRRTSGMPRETVADICIKNRSGYSARNPAVIVRLNGMVLQSNGLFGEVGGWWIVDQSGDGISALQWDGGTNYSIHGRSTRRLPSLDFGEISYLAERTDPHLVFELLAEGGYHRIISMPVSFEFDSEPSGMTGELGNASDWV
jgi:hypothetical protein